MKCVENCLFGTGAEQIVTSYVVIMYCLLSDVLDDECSTSCHSGRAGKCSCKGNFCLVPSSIYVGGVITESVFHVSHLCGFYTVNKLRTNLSARYVKPCNSVAVCFIMLTCLVPVLFTFYIQGVLKLKKNNSGTKGLIYVTIIIQVL